MPTAPHTKYFLADAEQKYIYVNGAGMVVQTIDVTRPDGNSAALEYSPDGWQGVLIKLIRNNYYLGLTRDFTVPMRFVRDGAKIARNQMWRYGQDTVTYLVIAKLNQTGFPPVYEPYYFGELDFSKISDKTESCTVQVTEGGASKWLKAYENTVYTVNISDDAQKKVVYFDGLPFTNTIDYTIYENQSIITSKYIGMGIVSQEGTTQGIVVQDQQGITTFDNPFDSNNFNENYHLNSTNKKITAKYRGSVNVQVQTTTASSVVIKLVKYNQSTDTTTDYIIYNGSLAVGLHNIPVNIDIPVNYNEYVYLVGDADGALSCRITTGAFTVTYDVTFTPTLCECLTYKRLGELLVAQMTNNTCTFRSSYLDSRKDDLFYTCGPALRKFQAQASGKISFRDYVQSLKQFGIIVGVEGTEIVLEQYSYGYRSDIAADLGVVDDCEITVDQEKTFNTIKTGYPNVEVDKVNSRDEFNITSNWATPHTRIVKELDLVSPVHAGMYEIEAARIELYQKDTTGSDVDTTSYMLNVNKGVVYKYFEGQFEAQINAGNYYFILPTPLHVLTPGTQFTVSGAASNNGTFTVVNTLTTPVVGFIYVQVAEPVTNAPLEGTITVNAPDYYKLNRPVITSSTGLLHPDEAFNVLLSPARALLNNGSYIRSFHDKLDGEVVKHTESERNSDMSTTIGGVTVDEDADVVIGSFAAPFGCGYTASFVSEVRENLYNIMKANPYSLYTFTWRGILLKGYIEEVGFAPASLEKQKIKLLLAAGTDTTKFIH